MLATGLRLADSSSGLPAEHLVSVRNNHCAVLALARLSGKPGVEVKWDLRAAWAAIYGDTKTPLFLTNTEMWRSGVEDQVLDRVLGLYRIVEPPCTVADCLLFAPCMVGWPAHVAALVGRTLYDGPKDRRTEPVDSLWRWIGA